MSIPGTEGKGVDRPESDDASLVIAALAGHPGAFDVLVRRYMEQAIGAARRMINDAEGAKDVAQDAFVRAYRGLRQLKDPDRFGPWLMRTVSNLSLNYRRARRNEPRPQVLEDADGNAVFDVADPHAGVSAETTELETVLTVVLQDLPDKQRLAIVLTGMRCLSHKEAAEIIGTTENNVKQLVFEGRRRIKDDPRMRDFLLVK